MIPNTAIEVLKKNLARFAGQGYEQTLDCEDKTNKYEASITKGNESVTIRDGYFSGQPDKKAVKLTSFDVLFRVGDISFLKYVSDYPLEEYAERLTEVFALIDAFFAGSYEVTTEKYLFFWRRKYLHIRTAQATEHLLGSQ